jgi:outer membrane protein TolC
MTKNNWRRLPVLVFFLIAVLVFPEEALPITLEQAYEMTIKNSLALKASRFELLAERRKLSLDYWTSLPSLNVSLSDSRITRYSAPDTNSVSLSSTLTVPVFNGGRVRMQRDMQQIALDLQSSLLSASEDELRNTCFMLFHEVQILYLKHNALQRMHTLTEQQYMITEKEYELGKAREIDLVDTRLTLDEVSHEVFSIESEILSQEYTFRKVLGIDQSINFVLVTELDHEYEGLSITNLVKPLYDTAIQRNPNIMQGRFKVEQFRINNRMANSKWLPNIKMQGSIQLSGEDYPLQNPNYGLRAIVEFPNELLPVNFSFGISTTPDREYGRSSSAMLNTPASLAPIVDKQLALMRLSQSVEEYMDMQRDIHFSLEQSILAYERQRRSQDLLKKRIQTQEKKVSILLTQAELGQITRLDYLEGESELLVSRLQYLSGVLALIQMEKQIESIAGLEAGELHFMARRNQ